MHTTVIWTSNGYLSRQKTSTYFHVVAMFPKWSLQFVAGFSYRLQNEEGIGESLPIPFRIFLHVRVTFV